MALGTISCVHNLLKSKIVCSSEIAGCLFQMEREAAPSESRSGGGDQWSRQAEAANNEKAGREKRENKAARQKHGTKKNGTRT